MRVLEPTESVLDEAAKVLRAGGLVVMPTETVYGLAGSAIIPEAIAKIFKAKGRPRENPLIVHIGSPDQLAEVAKSVTPIAQRIVDAFWPGPVTVVLEKASSIPGEVTGGGSTVAVRMPAHPVALELIRRSGHPVAAPSANRFMQLSPTRAEDVSPDLEVEIVLDGGACSVGIESTVVDCTGNEAVILRLGDIGREQLEGLLGTVGEAVAGERRSPGQYPRHYAPTTPLRISERPGVLEGGLTFAAPLNESQISMPAKPAAYAAVLYVNLHRLDAMGLSEIVVESPPESAEWAAIWDRLRRAATK